jgi:hypothetical protein
VGEPFGISHCDAKSYAHALCFFQKQTQHCHCHSLPQTSHDLEFVYQDLPEIVVEIDQHYVDVSLVNELFSEIYRGNVRGGLNDYHCHQKHVGGFPFRFHTVLEGMVASSGGRWCALAHCSIGCD